MTIYLSFSRTQGNPELILFKTPRTAPSNGAVAGELNMCVRFWLFELNQVEYTCDSGSDGYYSCKEDAAPYNGPECRQRNFMNELFKALVQERNEVMEAQKKTEVQLELMIKLAILVMEHFNNSFSSSQKEEVLAVTLRSRRQLEKSTPDYHQVPSETSEGKDDQDTPEDSRYTRSCGYRC
ncbi:hypothetical protein PIB30_076424 [Stylosanthes scabra]|uniref:Uncharacterized protein n=1 Tax=Stylosanthes scabra TaxID=79078 RepID=A0ABU6YMT8_9FABA|nr:hypothetical protein [Stylosanthes scabra]